MSAEYRPVTEIPFHVIDQRLGKYGIKLELHGAITGLIGPYGTLFARPEGNSTHFQRGVGVDTQAVVDEIDHRFWGFASHDDMLEAYSRSDRPSEFSPRNWVLVEGPSIGDANFTIAWLMAAIAADKALQAYFQEHPRFRERLRRIEIATLIEFAPCSMAFVRMWLQQKGTFSIDLFDSEDADNFPVMT